MVEKIKGMLKKTIIWTAVLGFMLITFEGCKTREKIFTIGVACYPSAKTQIFEGFKAGMVELGYIESKNVKYIYYSREIGNDGQLINAEIKKLLDQDIELLLTSFNETSIIAKKAVEGTNTPVIAVGCNRLVEIGLIQSLNNPGWNVTGVQFADTITKGFELLLEVKPDIKKVYLPYNIDNMFSTLQLNELEKAAAKMGIELVAQQVNSVEEAVSTIEGLSEDFDAMYELPSIVLSPKSSDLTKAAIRRGIPMAGDIPYNEEFLITFASDPFEMGRKAARLADQILQGAKPSDLPFETSETYLVINLQTAEKLGIDIPNSLLARAKTIIR